MNKRITVNDKVKFTEAFFLLNSSFREYQGKIGTVIKDDRTTTPYKVLFSDGSTLWARVDEVVLASVDMKSFTTYSVHKLLSLLLKGTVLYTTNGTKVHNKDGELMFNKSPLNWTKVTDLPLSTDHPDKAPFVINEVTGTHCKVWDNHEESATYDIIVKYTPESIYKFQTDRGIGWVNAVPVK